MNLKINNYNILNFENQDILISERGVARINSPSLLKVITKLKDKPTITENELYKLFHEHHLDKGDAYLSLKTLLGLEIEKENTYFKKTFVIHNWENHEELKLLINSELPEAIVAHQTSESTLNLELNAKNFFVLLCKNYDYEKIKTHYFKLSKNHPESAISVAYAAGDHFIISQPYLPNIGSPCHFCTIDRLIENESFHPSSNTWSRLLNFCRSKKTFTPAPRLSLYQKSIIIGALIQKIKLMTGKDDIYRYQDNILQETSISLNNGKIEESCTAHWCMCDCLRANP
jgi:McbB family protein